jgi:hypothetical protein
VINSATIKGVGLRAGGPYGFGYTGVGLDEIPADWITDSIALAKQYSADGLIDNVSNLSGAPVFITSCLKDTGSKPVLQELQKTFYEGFSADIKKRDEDIDHTTNWDDASEGFKHLYPRIAGSGITNQNQMSFGGFGDVSFQTKGKMIKFDQRLYTTPAEYSRANLAQWGFIYLPDKCAAGTVAQCHLSVFFQGCGGPAKLGEASEASKGSAHQVFGWSQMAAKNDIVMLFPLMRD